MTAYEILKAKYPDVIAQHIMESYREIESNFARRKWKASELDSGHFVEAVRRLLEHELTGSHTPFTAKLSNFTDAVLRQYEQASGDESFRLLIPRALKAIYNIRSKRGVGHIGGISPNQMDATLILYTAKWVLAELIRLTSGLPITETQKLIDQISTREIELVWKDTDITRILDVRVKAREQVLILLYDESPRAEDKLREIIEYRNATNFRKIIRRLHTQRLIEYRSDRTCLLSPTGSAEAEILIKKYCLA